MQYLTLFLLVGLGLASAYTSDFDDGLSIDRFENVDLTPYQAGGWISEQMRQTLEKMVEGFEKALEEGKTISERAFRKAEELYHKLLDWGIDVGEKIKEALERIGKDFENNELDQADNLLRAGDWITDRMRETFEKMVEGFEKAIEEGKTISERAFRKAEELYHKLLDWGVDVGEKIREAFERIAKDFDKNRAADLENPMQAGNWISDQMRQTLEKMVESFEKAIEEGKTISERAFRKAEELYHKLLDWGIDVGEKIKEAIERFGRDFDNNREQRGPMIDRLKEAFENVVNKMKEAFESGSGVRGDLMKKAEDIYEKLKNLKVEISDKIRSIFEDLKSKMGRNSVQHGKVFDRLKEAFENIVNRIKEKFDSGKGVDGGLMKKAEDIFEKLKNLRGGKISEKIKSIFEDLRSKMGRSGPTSLDADISNIFDVFRRLKQLIKEKLDSEKLKEKVEELFGKGSEVAEQIIEMLKTKGEKAKQKILDWIDRILPDKEERSISEVYDKLREFFKDLQLDLKERFTKFGEWVKEQYEKGLEKGKTRAENIKKIAKEFIEDTKVIGKDMAEEALGFFREYKKDLGKLYDNVVEKIGKILKS
ncbi:hypothetical protein HNY73_000330 [Argiope bruennichi]|uniref:Laminin subunit alpha-2 n=1 Tax=Argiope bruennichi TaxID=94029 RepID=A0A8T0G211_ARGBR|nr:hypothetical protein HNY73_000330 [Argiope bruennichi]